MPDLPLRPSGSRNLVMVRAGRDSLHPAWVAGPEQPGFDLLALPYEPGPALGPAPGIGAHDLPGRKVAGYAEAFRRFPALLDRYDFIALLDDDIATGRADLERLFSIGASHGLDLFQPSLSWQSHFSYAAFLHVPGFRLRFVNTIEMMCPVFRSSHLRRALPLFQLSYETGIDLLWCRLAEDTHLRHAVVDAVEVTHTRPVGTTKTRQGFDAGETYDRQIATVLARCGASFRGVVAYAAIDSGGRHTGSRTEIALRSASLLGAVARTPMPRALCLRQVADCIRHGLTRPLNLDRIDLPQDAAPALEAQS